MSSTTALIVEALQSTDVTGDDKNRHRRMSIDVFVPEGSDSATLTIVWWRGEVRSIQVPVGELDAALERIATGRDFQHGTVIG